MTKKTEGRTYEAGGQLPPMLLLRELEGEVKGELLKIDIDEEEDRTWYRVRLSEPVNANTNDKEGVGFDIGQVVSIPGSGHMNYLFSDVAEHFGVALPALVGFQIALRRLKDGEMKDGKFKGKPVKRYALKASEPVAA